MKRAALAGLIAAAAGALAYALWPRAAHTLGEAQGKALADAAWTATHGGDAPPLTALSGWGAARIVLSGSDGDEAAAVGDGAGDGPDQAFAAALAAFRKAYRPASGKPPLWVKAHIATGAPLASEVSDKQGLPLDESRTALGLPELGVTFLPEETLAHELVISVDKQDIVDAKAVQRVLDARGAPPAGLKAWVKSRTRKAEQWPVAAWFRDAACAYPTYRGHLVAAGPPGPAEIAAAATAAAAYLRRSLGDDGAFAYNYVPKRAAADGDYNILRHAGTIYAMMELDEALGLTDLRAGAAKAIAFLASRVKPCVGPDREAACVVEDDSVKLGGNALAVIALAKHAAVTGDRARLPLMQRLARRLTSVQDAASGEFTLHKQTYPDGKKTSFTSDYYPGEAILALMRLYALDGDERWAEAAAKGARYLIDVRDHGKSLEQLDHDHWLLYGLEELYAARKDPAFLAHTRRIVQAIAGEQIGARAQAPDWAGAWFDEPRGTPAATRAEGLMAAQRTFLRAGDAAAAAGALAGARAASRFLLATQLGPERVMYFPEPRRALGGFGESLTAYEVRIDYVQHSVSALLAVRAALLR